MGQWSSGYDTRKLAHKIDEDISGIFDGIFFLSFFSFFVIIFNITYQQKMQFSETLLYLSVCINDAQHRQYFYKKFLKLTGCVDQYGAGIRYNL
jgi:hypothetical protein